MIRHGDDNIVHFTKLRGGQMSELRSVLDRRPKIKFSQGLSAEAQEAMQQAAEDTKIEMNARRGKRCSKGNVLFSDTVTIRTESVASKNPSRLGFTGIYGDGALSPRPRGNNSRRGSVVHERRSSLVDSVNALNQVEIANKLTQDPTKLSPDKKLPGGKRGSTELANEKCRNWLQDKHS